MGPMNVSEVKYVIYIKRNPLSALSAKKSVLQVHPNIYNTHLFLKSGLQESAGVSPNRDRQFSKKSNHSQSHIHLKCIFLDCGRKRKNLYIEAPTPIIIIVILNVNSK